MTVASTAASLGPVATAAAGTGDGAAVGNADRLAATLCLAVIVHALVVFGIGFREAPLPDPRYDALEVVLVTRHDTEAPEDARLAAAANQVGGGDATENERPAAPSNSPFLDEAAADAAPAERIAQPAPEVPPPAPAGETAEAQAAPAPPEEELLAAERAEPERPEIPEVETPEPEPEAEPEERTAGDRPKPSAAELIASSMELASLNAELDQRLEAKAKRPRRKYISASTREYKYAAYLEAWRAKVERVGNLNYPDEARAKRLSGSLLLDVALNPDGSVREITIRRSSGHDVLDDAAVRIVELAAPYAPLPPNIRKEVDILHITRTWQFLNDSRFAAD